MVPFQSRFIGRESVEVFKICFKGGQKTEKNQKKALVCMKICEFEARFKKQFKACEERKKETTVMGL